nr:hypothetical protein [Tanacetum cinerariifolium]
MQLKTYAADEFDMDLSDDNPHEDNDDASIKEKYNTSITKHYAVRAYKEGVEDMIPKKWSKEVHRYHFVALNGIHHWEEDIIDFFKAGMSVVTKGNVYSDLRIKSVVKKK